MSAAPPALPLHVGDYLTDTAHLTIEHSGAYLHLLMYGWRSGRIPDDETDLSRLCRVSARYWRTKIAPAVLPFFERRDGLLISKRLEAERGKAIEKSAKQSARAKARWEPPVSGSETNPEAKIQTFLTPKCSSDGNGATKENNNLANAVGMPPLPYPLPVQVRKEGKERTAVVDFGVLAPPANPHGTRLPPTWVPGLEGEVYARSLGLNHIAVAADFRDYWCAKPGKEARKLDWGMTWKRWCRTEAERRGRFAPPARPSKPIPVSV